MMTNVVGCLPDEVRCGMAVAVTWEPLGDGRQLPLFRRGPGQGVVSVPEDRARRARPQGMLHAWWAARIPDRLALVTAGRRPHLRGPQRRHQPPEPGAASPRPRTGRLHRTDVHEPARVPRGALRRPAHRPAPHAHQLAPDRGGGGLHRRELRGEGVRLLGRAGREGHRGGGGRWAGPGQDQHRRLPARLRDVQHGGRRRGRVRHRRPGRRHPDALHVGHHGPAQGRAPGRARRRARWPPSTSAATTRTGRPASTPTS